jgi:hypothetical protein
MFRWLASGRRSAAYNEVSLESCRRWSPGRTRSQSMIAGPFVPSVYDRIQDELDEARTLVE